MSRESDRGTITMSGSIQGRVTKRLLLGTLLAGVAANAGIYSILRHEVKEQFDLALEARARALTSLVIAESERGPLTFPFAGREQPEFRHRQRRGDYFQIWDPQGNTVARSLSLGNGNLPMEPSKLDSIGDRLFDAPLPDGRPGHCIEVRFAPFISQPGSGFATSEHARQMPLSPPARLVLAADREELNITLGTLFRTLAVSAVSLAAATTMLVVFVVRDGLRPLRRMAEEAAGLDAEHLDAHRFAEADLPDELRPIAQRLNDSLSKLGSAFARERRFTSDAAHELRTPIAEIRSLSEVALRWPPATAQENEANYRLLLASARQMESVVAALLTLARHHREDGQTRVSGEPVLVADVVADAWRSHETAALARGLTMTLDLPADQILVADRPILLALLHNLFSNVTAYAPLDSAASCVGRDHGLSIANGRGSLTQDDLAQITRPFWRKEASRSSRDAHVGLGLTLVMEYARAIGINCSFAIDGDQFIARLDWTPADRETPIPETENARAR